MHQLKGTRHCWQMPSDSVFDFYITKLSADISATVHDADNTHCVSGFIRQIKHKIIINRKKRSPSLCHGSSSYSLNRIGISPRVRISFMIRCICPTAVSGTSKSYAIYSYIYLRSHLAPAVYTIFHLISRNPVSFLLPPHLLKIPCLPVYPPCPFLSLYQTALL